MLTRMLTRMHHTLPNKQTHHAKVMSLDIKVLCLGIKYLDIKVCGVQVCGGGGGVEMWERAVVGIHIPPYKKTKMDFQPTQAVR